MERARGRALADHDAGLGGRDRARRVRHSLDQGKPHRMRQRSHRPGVGELAWLERHLSRELYREISLEAGAFDALRNYALACPAATVENRRGPHAAHCPGATS
jgi:hypothetical protein